MKNTYPSNIDPNILKGEFPFNISNSSERNNCIIRELYNKILLNSNNSNDLGPNNIVCLYI